MSTDEKLARMNLLHLKDNPQELRKALEEKIRPLEEAESLWKEVYDSAVKQMAAVEDPEIKKKIWSEAIAWYERERSQER